MAKRPKDRGLGRGLSALLSDVSPALADDDAAPASPDATSRTPTVISGLDVVPTHRLTRNPAQPRLRFDRARLQELANSLSERGVLQPILVRPLPASSRDVEADYQIVAGERRYQAALLAKIGEVPVIVRDLSDRDVLEIGVIENVQRANLNPIEEARAYATLASDFDRTHEDIARAIGKSRPYVSNAIRLTQLPDVAQEYLLDGKLTAGHARAILASDDPKAVADAIVSRSLSVREAEALASPKKRRAKMAKRPEIRLMERDLEERLGARVEVIESRGGKITLKLGFSDARGAEAVVKTLLGLG